MKKFLFLSALMALVSFGFSSCDKDDDGADNGNVTADIVFNTSMSSDLQSIYGIVATYSIKAAGTLKEGTNNSVRDGLEFNNIPCPCTIAVKFQFMQQGTVDPDKTYNINYHYDIDIETKNEKGKIDVSLEEGNLTHTGKGEEIVTLMSNMNSAQKVHNFSISKDGIISD